MLTLKGLLYSVLLLGVQGALNPIEIKGAKFFDSVTGEQYFMMGMAYQPRQPALYDVLSKPEYCRRDAELLQAASINMIRVYETYSKNDHDECMKIFDDAGIYVAIDLPESRFAINRDDPEYTLDFLDHFIEKVNVFSKYSNTLMFFAGNEVANEIKTTPSAAYIKASLRDIKAHIKTLKRYIPIGYADNDDWRIREQVQEFFNCGTDAERADFYGINIYAWCGQSTFKTSGYDNLTSILSSYSTPVFLSEAGCNIVRPRTFGDFVALYTKDMDKVFSGGIAYEYSDFPNAFGVVDITGETVKPRDDYFTLQKIFKAAKPTGIKKDDYKPENKNRECPSPSVNWKPSPKLPPPASKKVCDCAMESLVCKLTKEGEDPKNGKKVEEQMGIICGNGLCNDISSDAEKGEYGMYSTCPSTVKASIAMNAAVLAGAECKFDDLAEKQAPIGSSDQCKAIVSEVQADLDSGKGSGKGSSDGVLSKLSISAVLLAVGMFSVLA